METVYQVCAAVGGTLVVCQFLAALLGLGGGHDLGGGHGVGGGHDIGSGHDLGSGDASGHHEGGAGSDPNWFFNMLTFRTLTAASAFFGLAGLASIRFALEPTAVLIVALLAGAAAFFLVGWLVQFLSRLNLDGTIRIERAVARGTVYLSVPGAKSGVGKVHVSQLNRTIEYKAITSQEHLPTGAKIVVVNVVNADTVEVASETSSQASRSP